MFLISKNCNFWISKSSFAFFNFKFFFSFFCNFSRFSRSNFFFYFITSFIKWSLHSCSSFSFCCDNLSYIFFSFLIIALARRPSKLFSFCRVFYCWIFDCFVIWIELLKFLFFFGDCESYLSIKEEFIVFFLFRYTGLARGSHGWNCFRWSSLRILIIVFGISLLLLLAYECFDGL